jgi:glucokinase
VLALDLGGTQIRAAVIQPDGARLARAAASTPVEDGPGAIVERCLATLRVVVESLSTTQVADLAGIGISAPGPVDPAQGVILDPPNLGAEFHDIPLAASVSQAFALPTFLDRDTNVAALGEHAFGAGRGVDDFVYVTISTGIGGGILAGGRLFHGPDGLAGELGHVPVEVDGPPCGCGGHGHLEAVSSGTALARDARAAAADGSSPYLAARATAGASLEARDVAAGEDAGDPVCGELMTLARRAIATACVGFVSAFNPHRIIIGGSIAEAQGDRLLGLVRTTIRQEAFRSAGSRVDIVAPELGADVSLAGAHPLVMTGLASDDQPITTAASPTARDLATTTSTGTSTTATTQPTSARSAGRPATLQEVHRT